MNDQAEAREMDLPELDTVSAGGTAHQETGEVIQVKGRGAGALR